MRLLLRRWRPGRRIVLRWMALLLRRRRLLVLLGLRRKTLRRMRWRSLLVRVSHRRACWRLLLRTRRRLGLSLRLRLSLWMGNCYRRSCLRLRSGSWGRRGGAGTSVFLWCCGSFLTKRAGYQTRDEEENSCAEYRESCHRSRPFFGSERAIGRLSKRGGAYK